MTVGEAIRARRSIRKYQAGHVIPQEQLDAILEAGMLAPSAMNLRPYEFVVLRDRGKFPGIIRIHPYARMLETASVCIVVCGFSGDGGSQWFQQDCGAVTENMLLQALEFGLGTCWCGVYPVMDRVEGFKKLLGIDSTPFGLIALGLPDESPAMRGRYEAAKVRYV
ncbi:MAG: nitroreductase family protein [Treponema sp.]|jgi:nitroreductase|nr:nitroreductase family protein [Treponema sp.]